MGVADTARTLLRDLAVSRCVGVYRVDAWARIHQPQNGLLAFQILHDGFVGNETFGGRHEVEEQHRNVAIPGELDDGLQVLAIAIDANPRELLVVELRMTIHEPAEEVGAAQHGLLGARRGSESPFKARSSCFA